MTVKKQPCPNCRKDGKDNSGDNLVIYDNGSYCFACGYMEGKEIKNEVGFLEGIYTNLDSRAISKRTCEIADYKVSKYNGELCHVANYKNALGKLIGQKVRLPNKKFLTLGDINKTLLYGLYDYEPTENLFAVICEGEIDRLSIMEMNRLISNEKGLNYPVLSIPLGAASAKEAISANLIRLNKWKHIILAFDNDEAGKEAIEQCLALFEPYKVKILDWPLKDANELLLAGRYREYNDLVFNARSYQPKNIVTFNDIRDRVLAKPEIGIPYIWPTLTEITYGMKTKELTIWVGARGTGKTEIMQHIIFDLINNKDLVVGLFSFEQDAEDTMQRMIGSKIGQRLHLFEGDWNEDQILKEGNLLNEKLFLYDNTFALSKQDLLNGIKYLVKVKGVKLIVIDNLKGLAKGMSNENQEIKQYMLDFQQLARSLDVAIFLISHVAKDKFQYQTYISTSPKNPDEYLNRSAEDMERFTNKPGLSWESGRMPTVDNIEGTGAIADLANYVFAIARDLTNQDSAIKNMTRIKCLKARRKGDMMGKVFKLNYTDKGQLEEILEFGDNMYEN